MEPSFIQNARYSLAADLATGWKPSLKIIGPVPLNFDNLYMDPLINQMLLHEDSKGGFVSSEAQKDEQYSVVYLGPRPNNSLEMHRLLARNYRYRYDYLLDLDNSHLKGFFQKLSSSLQSKYSDRPFVGMNPKLPSKPLAIGQTSPSHLHKGQGKSLHPLRRTVQFEASFEGANLDAAIQVNVRTDLLKKGDQIPSEQYDLVLRGDSNTHGHVMWFNFILKDLRSPAQTANRIEYNMIRLNLVNLRHDKCCYDRVQYCCYRNICAFSKHDYPKGIASLCQAEQYLVSVRHRNKSYNITILIRVCQSLNKTLKLQRPKLFRRFSFSLILSEGQQVQVAYCVPFSYSDLMQSLRELRLLAAHRSHIQLSVDSSHQSLSGLQIPIIKIKDSNVADDKEKDQLCILIMARQHPGESNSSWVAKGLLEELVTGNNAIFLKRVVVYVIPMLNVDGVVMGNFRCSLFGHDLNRMYRAQDTLMYPEVAMCHSLVHDLQKIHESRLLLLIDLHGHSFRRNSFCYGPGGVQSGNEPRLLPKLIAAQTDIFRYPSCTFRNNLQKKNTARVVYRDVFQLCYTIESSNWAYYSQKTQKTHQFDIKGWQSVGKAVAKSIINYVLQRIKLEQLKLSRLQDIKMRKIIRDKQSPKKLAVSKKDKEKVSQRYSTLSTKGKIEQLSVDLKTSRQSSIQKIPKDVETPESDPLNEENSVRNSFSTMLPVLKEYVREDSAANSSGDSDSSQEDFSKEQMRRLIKETKKMMKEFEKAYYGQQQSKKAIKDDKRPVPKQRQNITSRTIQNRTVTPKKIEVLACLRKPQASADAKLSRKLGLNDSELPKIRNSYQTTQVSPYASPSGLNRRSNSMNLPSSQPRRRNIKRAEQYLIKGQIHRQSFPTRHISEYPIYGSIQAEAPKEKYEHLPDMNRKSRLPNVVLRLSEKNGTIDIPVSRETAIRRLPSFSSANSSQTQKIAGPPL